MKNTTKILIGVSIRLLIIGIAAASDTDSFKPLKDYKDFDDIGYSNYTTNNNRYFLVEKVTLDDDLIDEWFTTNPDNEYSITPVEGNMYFVEDDLFGYYGYQEIVELDGEHFMVSVNQNSKLSPSEKNLYLGELKEFNKLNNLEPVEL